MYHYLYLSLHNARIFEYNLLLVVNSWHWPDLFIVFMLPIYSILLLENQLLAETVAWSYKDAGSAASCDLCLLTYI